MNKTLGRDFNLKNRLQLLLGHITKRTLCFAILNAIDKALHLLKHHIHIMSSRIIVSALFILNEI